MASRLPKILFNYFYHSSVVSGLVLVNCDFRSCCVRKSVWKIAYAIIWSSFFVTNYFHACNATFHGYNESYVEGGTVSNTTLLELCATYIIMLLFIFTQFVNLNSSALFLTKLMKLASHFDGSSFSVDRELVLMALFGDFIFVYLYFWNLFMSYDGGARKLFVLSPFENSILNTFVAASTSLAMSRFSMFLAMCIDIVQKFVKTINRRIEIAFESADSSISFESLQDEISSINQLYNEASKVIKLFERNYGLIILIIQCVDLIIAINQLFFLYVAVSKNAQIGLMESAFLMVSVLYFFQLCLVIKLSKRLQREGTKAKHLLNCFNFVPADLPETIEKEIEILKLQMIHNPINIQICGMFSLNYFVLYAIISGGAGYLVMLVQFQMAG